MKKNIHITKDKLSSYIRQTIEECLSNKLVDLTEDNQNAKVLSNQQLNDTSILRKDDGNKPMTYDYLFDLHKGLPEEYFEPTDILYDPNEVAMYTIPTEVVQDLGLNEGLIKTYDSRKSIDFVCSLFDQKGYQVTPNSFLVDTPNDDCSIYGHIRIQIPFNQLNREIDETLKQGFNTCGYHLGKTYNRINPTTCETCIVYQFEPKYQTNSTNPNFGRFIYHVTTENACRKIMKNGLCPSNRTKSGFKYSERCYFFTVYNTQLFSSYMAQAGKINRSGQGNFNRNYKILKIDRNLLQNVDFYTDPNFPHNVAVFTYNNIPPTAIVNCEDL